MCVHSRSFVVVVVVVCWLLLLNSGEVKTPGVLGGTSSIIGLAIHLPFNSYGRELMTSVYGNAEESRGVGGEGCLIYHTVSPALVKKGNGKLKTPN